MNHPLLALGQVNRAGRITGTFSGRQNVGGFFHSQEGEWISNGQQLWIVARLAEVTERHSAGRWKMPWPRACTGSQGSERQGNARRVPKDWAFPAGELPEAIHPITLDRCMGDGQHGVVAGEWIMRMWNSFVRQGAGELLVRSGILPEWLAGNGPIECGPTLAAGRTVGVSLTESRLTMNAQWREIPLFLEVMVPRYEPVDANASNKLLEFQKS